MQTKLCIECGAKKSPAKFRTANICKTCRRARLRMERRLHGRDQVSPSVERTP
jgi:hypothetical protein